MKFPVTAVASLASIFGAASALVGRAHPSRTYSIVDFATENAQLDQPIDIDFNVTSPHGGKVDVLCTGSTGYNMIHPTNASASGQQYTCQNPRFSFIWEQGQGNNDSSLYVYQQLDHSAETLAGVVSFPNPVCEPTPLNYLCRAASNYTITLEYTRRPN